MNCSSSQQDPRAARLIEILAGFEHRANSFWAVIGSGGDPFERVEEALILLKELGFPPNFSRELKALFQPNWRMSPAYRRERCNEFVRGLRARLRSLPSPAERKTNAPAGDGQGGAGTRKPGRRPKSRPSKFDRVISSMIDSGDVERYARKWKSLRERYAGELPKRLTADGLRKRVEREEARRAADKK